MRSKRQEGRRFPAHTEPDHGGQEDTETHGGRGSELAFTNRKGIGSYENKRSQTPYRLRTSTTKISDETGRVVFEIRSNQTPHFQVVPVAPGERSHRK
jgi:hypothetical protein